MFKPVINCTAIYLLAESLSSSAGVKIKMSGSVNASGRCFFIPPPTHILRAWVKITLALFISLVVECAKRKAFEIAPKATHRRSSDFFRIFTFLPSFLSDRQTIRTAYIWDAVLMNSWIHVAIRQWRSRDRVFSPPSFSSEGSRRLRFPLKSISVCSVEDHFIWSIVIFFQKIHRSIEEDLFRRAWIPLRRGIRQL